MERPNAWKKYTPSDLEAVDRLAADYIGFISRNKTERECAAEAIKLAEEAGYVSLDAVIDEGRYLKPGDKVYSHTHGKSVLLVHLGEEPLSAGLNILGAHIDSPRLDVKQNPLYESTDFALLDTHYYGGIKKYQWVTLPLALHGVVAKTDGSVVPVVVGEDPADPVFCVSDLLIHLAQEQMKKEASTVIEGEQLDLLVGSRPLVLPKDAKDDAAGKPADAATSDDADAQKTPAQKLAEKEPVKAYLLQLLAEKYGMAEEDFLSAELEVVPAGPAREMGFDRSMIIGYGQDDRVCAYTSLVAQLALDQTPKRTAVTLLVDKEEIGSVGATGMTSKFFENALAEIINRTGEMGCDAVLAMRRGLRRSRMLSSDVSAGVDPNFKSAFEEKNASFLGRGLVFNKFTGARGKSGSNDAGAEYVAQVRRIMEDADVAYQTAELGRVDLGGGGTIAYILAEYDMDVIDSGVAILSMHSPWEVSSKADVYEAYKGYVAFLKSE